jgi:hypothetical protein
MNLPRLAILHSNEEVELAVRECYDILSRLDKCIDIWGWGVVITGLLLEREEQQLMVCLVI